MPRQRSTRQLTNTRQYLQSQEKAMDFMFNIALGAISLVFVGLTFAYTFGRRLSENWEVFSLPKSFWLSTVLLAGSSFAFHQARQAYSRDDVRKLRLGLWAAFVLGTGFLVSQYAGWQSLKSSGIALSGSPSGSYLFVITWLHAGHIVLGLILLAFTLQTVYSCTRDDIQSLLFLSDPQRNRRLRMVSLYWHVVDGLWLYLFIFFLFFHS